MHVPIRRRLASDGLEPGPEQPDAGNQPTMSSASKVLTP